MPIADPYSNKHDPSATNCGAASHPVINALTEALDVAAAAYEQDRNEFTRYALAQAESRLLSVVRHLGLT